MKYSAIWFDNDALINGAVNKLKFKNKLFENLEDAKNHSISESNRYGVVSEARVVSFKLDARRDLDEAVDIYTFDMKGGNQAWVKA